MTLPCCRTLTVFFFSSSMCGFICFCCFVLGCEREKEGQNEGEIKFHSKPMTTGFGCEYAPRRVCLYRLIWPILSQSTVQLRGIKPIFEVRESSHDSDVSGFWRGWWKSSKGFAMLFLVVLSADDLSASQRDWRAIEWQLKRCFRRGSLNPARDGKLCKFRQE